MQYGGHDKAGGNDAHMGAMTEQEVMMHYGGHDKAGGNDAIWGP